MARLSGLLLVALAIGLTDSGDSDSSEDSGTTVASERGTTVASDPGTATAECPKGTVAEEDVVGLTVEQAQQVARQQGCNKIRVIQRDGKDLPVTLDFQTDRLNVAVEDGKVTGVDGVY